MKSSREHRRKRLPLKIWLPILIVLVVAGVAAAVIFIAMPHSEKDKQLRDQSSKATQLHQDHQNCIKKLNQDYQALDSANQDAYQKAYDACETIRKEQNEAVDNYNRLINVK